LPISRGLSFAPSAFRPEREGIAFHAIGVVRGIRNDHTVVLYGGNNHWSAAYAYWYFERYGHPDVRLLDGGPPRWHPNARGSRRSLLGGGQPLACLPACTFLSSPMSTEPLMSGSCAKAAKPGGLAI
jgi:Rhodanese-like domain